MQHKKTYISGWNNYPIKPCSLSRPEKYKDLKASTNMIARGQGRSYGDASLNSKGQVLLTERMSRFLAFDKQRGILKAEAGVTLAEILPLIVPAGWFLPVTPGTQFVSLGGCVAADVHGKNHHRTGSFGQHVIELELITADNKTIVCSPIQQADYFWATLGGMGLTGIIGTVTLQLTSVPSAYLAVKHYPTQTLEETFNYLADPAYDDEYTVAWLDCLNTSHQGRGIVMAGHHALPEELPNEFKQNLFNLSKTQHCTVPCNMPAWFLNNPNMKLYNDWYYKKHARNTSAIYMDYATFFYPLDNVLHWNRLYGKAGFIQYQCVLPSQQALTGIKLLLEKLAQAKIPIFLAVLKRLGESNKGLLSFPMSGYTLALDIPIRDSKLFNMLDELDKIVLNHTGRVYLAKDARMQAETFQKMYPNYPEWLKIKKQLDPKNYFNSDLSERLQIGI